MTGDDYWDVAGDIDNSWPTALMATHFYYEGGSDDKAHWVAIKGYEYPSGPYNYAVICTDSYRGRDSLWLDWDHIGWPPVFTVTIKD